ncbi:MAG: Ig-like domain-containing protein [Gemmatimonadaceae bacterium]|nr:Ig-like domain-containing protein [Gemmatimonadaceae bacterium]
MRVACRSKFGSLLSVLACAIVLFSCGGDSTGPVGGSASVTVTPSTDSLALGASVTLHAAVTDAGGNAVSGASVFWSSENPATATVSSGGVVTGIAIGVVRIAASSNGKSGFSTITVVPPGVSSVRVSPASAAIKVGETVHLQADALDASGNVLPGRTVTWTSTNTDVATVDNTGLVTGVGAGATTITATSEGKSGTAGIAVAAAVAASITVAPTNVTITTGQTSQLTATVKDANGVVISGALVTWTVDHSNIALVSSTGLVTGQAQGSAIVTATSGGVHVDVPITVTLPPANAVIVSPSTVALLVSQTQQLTATITDAGGNTIPGTVTWSSNNSGVASVSATGVVTANAPGNATITGTSGSVSGVAQVSVSLVPVRRVVVTPDALSFTVGDPATQLVVTLLDSIGGTLSQTGRPVTFASNNTSVATVSGTGLVSPVGPGTAVITVTQTGSGLTAQATVTVTRVPVASVTIAPALDTLIVGQAVQLAATTKDGSGNTLTGRTIVWDGSDDNIASVSSNGRVTAIAPGTITVTATSEGKTGTATIVVIAVPVASVTISPTSAAVLVGSNTAAFTAVAKDGSGNVLNGRTITFASSNTAVATVNASTGVATGVAPGTANITASSEGKTSNAATLTVSAVPVASVTISPTSASVQAGAATPAFTAVTKDGSGNVLTGRTVTYSSTNPAVATVNVSTGVATGVSAGTTSIIASSEGKNSPAATLTVTTVPVTSVTISPTSASVQAGANTPAFTAVTKDGSGNVLTGRVVTFASSNTAVATIDPSTGVATGVAAGTANISASSEGKTSNIATLTVTAVPVASVTLSPTSASVQAGATTPAFTAVTKDGSGNVLTGRVVNFASSNTAVATIDPSTGVATGVAAGTTNITASSEGKTSNIATLTVTPAPVSTVTVSPATQTIVDGNSASFTATLKDAQGNVLTGRIITWSSSDITVATVDNAGNATSTGPGTTTITATSEGQSGSATLQVDPVPVTSIAVTPPLALISVGNTVQLTAVVQDNGHGHGHKVDWSSSDDAIATVDKKGVVTGQAPGFATITASAQGQSGNAIVNVQP